MVVPRESLNQFVPVVADFWIVGGIKCEVKREVVNLALTWQNRGITPEFNTAVCLLERKFGDAFLVIAIRCFKVHVAGFCFGCEFRDAFVK